MARIWHCCGSGVGWWLQLRLTPSQETSISCGCGPKKDKRQTNKQKEYLLIENRIMPFYGETGKKWPVILLLSSVVCIAHITVWVLCFHSLHLSFCGDHVPWLDHISYVSIEPNGNFHSFSLNKYISINNHLSYIESQNTRFIISSTAKASLCCPIGRRQLRAL